MSSEELRRVSAGAAAGVHGAGGVCAAGEVPLTPNGKLDRQGIAGAGRVGEEWRSV